MRHLDQPDTSQDMASRTAGIEVGIINVPGVGEFRKMDMAGHSWAFTSNEYFIGKRTSISLVLFDLSKTDKEIEDDLFHHLGCLKARETKCGVLRYRPEVVLIATHPDKLASDPQPRANAYFRMVMDSFQAYMNFYLKVMVLNCTNPNILDFNALRECLKTLRGKIIKVCRTFFYHNKIKGLVTLFPTISVLALLQHEASFTVNKELGLLLWLWCSG